MLVTTPTLAQNELNIYGDTVLDIHFGSGGHYPYWDPASEDLKRKYRGK